MNNKLIEELYNKIDNQENIIRELQEKIENKNKWLQLIIDIGFDYDGYNDADNLKLLITELAKYSLYAKENKDYYKFLKGEE